MRFQPISFLTASRAIPLALLLIGLLAGTFDSVQADEPATADKSAQNEGKTPEKKFSVVLLPDTQNYSEKYPDTYIAQTLWIRKQREADNIKFVIHLGDIVQHSTIESEWLNANRAMEILDGVVPYSVVPGNHDLVVETRDSTLYNKYFSPARFKDRPWYGGHFGETNDNNYCVFEACGLKFMVISLEYAPRDEVLDWAADLAAKHPEHHVIVATHCYLSHAGRQGYSARRAKAASKPPAKTAPKNTTKIPSTKGANTTPQAVPKTTPKTVVKIKPKSAGNSGEQIWQKLVRKSPNIFFVISGHFTGTALQTSINNAGRPVLEMLTDYQGLPNGGDGWLRSLEFVPSENKIHVKTYSPLLDRTNATFTIDYELPPTLKKAG